MPKLKRQTYKGKDYASIAELWREVVKPTSSMGYAYFKSRVRKLGLIDAIERPLLSKSESGRIGSMKTRNKFRLPGSTIFDDNEGSS